MAEDLIRKIYVSSAVDTVTQGMLNDILTVSRKNNPAQGVTGVLIYHDGTFLQVLEGSQHALNDRFPAIERDTRHRGIITLIDLPTEYRCFTEWSMGFAQADGLPSDQRSRFFNLKEILHSSREDLTTNDPVVSKIMLSFIAGFRDLAA